MESERKRAKGREAESRNFLVVQWLGLSTFIAKGLGSVPDLGTKTPQVSWSDEKKKKKKSESISHPLIMRVKMCFMFLIAY